MKNEAKKTPLPDVEGMVLYIRMILFNGGSVFSFPVTCAFFVVAHSTVFGETAGT